MRLHESISDDLLNEIRTGKLKVGTRIPSSAELSEQYGVSHVTVLNAFKQLAGQGWIKRQDGVGYFVRGADRAEARAATSSILSLLRPLSGPNPMDFYMNTVNCGIQTALYQSRYHLVWPHCVSGLLATPVSRDTNRVLVETARDYASEVSGMLLDERIDDPTISAIREAVDVPIVLVNRPTSLPVPAIAPANESGSRQAAQYALRAGYDTFVVCECKAEWSGRLNHEVRAQAFRQTLRDRRVPAARIHRVGDFLQMDHAEKLDELGALLESLPAHRKVLLFTATDHLGRSVCDYLIAAGRRPGKDIGLISFDSIALARAVEPHLTTVDPHPEAIGRLAVQALLAPHSALPTTREAPFTLANGDTA